MKLTAQELSDAYEVLTQLLNGNIPESTPRGTQPAMFKPASGFRLAALHRRLLPDAQAFAAQRDALIQRYGEVDPETDKLAMKKTSANWDAFSAEFGPLQDAEVEIPDCYLCEADFEGKELPGIVFATLLPFYPTPVADNPPPASRDAPKRGARKGRG